MARTDLKEMDAGVMDPAGRSQTQTARLLAMISTIAWPVLFSCCCCGVIGNQFIRVQLLILPTFPRRFERKGAFFRGLMALRRS
jgi:hypothetical protein